MQPAPPLPAVILAGGLSRRMGGSDKAFLDVGGRMLLDHVQMRLRPQVGPLAVNANANLDRYGVLDLPVLQDPMPGHPGPLAGVLAAMLWARQEPAGASHVLTVPVDTPLIPPDLVGRLAASAKAGTIVCAMSGGRLHPLVALWPVGLADDVRQALAEESIRRVTEWISRHPSTAVDWPVGAADPFLNINTPEDAERFGPLLT